MIKILNRKKINGKSIFHRKTGIFVQILIPLLFLCLPILFLTYSESIGRTFLPFLPEGTAKKIPLYIKDIEFQTRLILILTFILALFLGALISWRFSRSLGRVSDGLKKVLTGDLDFRIKIGSYDEIGEVSHFLNRLVDNLKASRLKLLERETELQEKSLQLTEKIKSLEASSLEAERTRLATLNILEDVEEARVAIQGRLEELEKFNKLAVGRELRMMDLKEEIKKLKEELEEQRSFSVGRNKKITN